MQASVGEASTFTGKPVSVDACYYTSVSVHLQSWVYYHE